MPTPNEKLARIRRIAARQSKIAWGDKYVPAIFATRQEAPRCSRPTVFKPLKLGRRDMHLMSTIEAGAALLALYDPATFDVHEQHCLSPVPALHPLTSHPSSVGKQFPPLKGTVEVASRLGHLSWHSKVYDVAEERWRPDVYVGDLLLFRADARGRYCVNWTIKASPADFERRGPRLHGKPRSGPSARARFRHQLESEYFSDAAIRTQRVTGEELDVTLIRNLEELFRYHALPIDVPNSVRQEIEAELARHIGTEVSAFRVLHDATTRWNVDMQCARTIMYQAIWRRTLRVDLFRALVVDKPLHTESRDPLAVYASWFTR